MITFAAAERATSFSAASFSLSATAEKDCGYGCGHGLAPLAVPGAFAATGLPAESGGAWPEACQVAAGAAGAWEEALLARPHWKRRVQTP